MLHAGRAGVSEVESAAVDKLIEKNQEAAISFTRQDADLQGPLLVHVDESTYVVQPDGKTRKKAN